MNRLADQTSPYLRQHATNPVPWFPWGEEAFAAARERDVPLFVSIGYASCHWCHVMAHESFEDPEVADLLRRSLVSVKVDREERPDVDAVYMSAVQALTGAGGWPMTVFCTPDGRPFFAGTYYPPSDRPGMPSFRRLVGALVEAWRDRRDEVERQADALVAAVRRDVRLTDHLAPAAGAGAPPPDFAGLLDALVNELAPGFDPEWGGFSPAPKFPRPTLVELCLRHHRRGGDPAALAMATTALDAMAAGGLYDHLVGGFCRYATDRRWLVPHFEKMLTDQALLARAYLHAWRETARPAYLQVVTETLDYVVDRLSAPGGGLYSSEDADAAGVEGGHATFSAEEARAVLTRAGRPELAGPVLEWYGITEAGNWEGTNVLHRPLHSPLARPADIEVGRRLLQAARAARAQPALDDKVLTEWNAMAACVLAEASAATGMGRWGAAAGDVVEFLFAELRRPDGRWLRSWQGGRARHLAFAADHAWLVESCLALAQLTGRARWIERATSVADQLLALFWDGPVPADGVGSLGAGEPGAGGFCTTGRDAEALVARPKELVDGAVPSANAVATSALFRLAALTGEPRYRAAAERVVALAEPLLRRHPGALADLVAATALGSEGAEVVVTGDRPDLVDETRRRWLPPAVVAWGEPTASPLWRQRPEGLAFVCRGFVCAAPTGDPVVLASQLDGLDRPPDDLDDRSGAA